MCGSTSIAQFREVVLREAVTLKPTVLDKGKSNADAKSSNVRGRNLSLDVLRQSMKVSRSVWRKTGRTLNQFLKDVKGE
jgi:hypothetical protein